jgi:hypothetical protein
MIAPNTFSQFQEEQICSFEHQCREILARGANGATQNAEASAASGDKVHEQAAKLIELTARLFPPGILEVSREYDPDSPGYTYLVIDATASGEFADIFRREDEWHAGVRAIFADPATWLNLCVYPR